MSASNPSRRTRRRPSPRRAVGLGAANLFSSVGSSLTTVLFVALALWLLPPLIAWATTRAVWVAPDGALCRQHQDGACWAFIAAKLDYLRFGSYPITERWRVNVVEGIGAGLIVWLLWPGAPRRGLAALLFFVAYPIVAFVLLHGSRALGLPVVDTQLWGGIFVSLLTAVVGDRLFAAAWRPAGARAALADCRSCRAASVMFIEFVRGVPFITVLFMANTMLPLFLPEGWTPDRFLRPLVGIALFSAAYMAEEVRGGLQSLGRGQYEGAMALGLNYPLMMGLVVLPQALTLVIPGHRQQFRRPVHGYDAGLDRRHDGFPRRDEQRLQGSGLERPDDPRDRLRLRGHVLFRLLLAAWRATPPMSRGRCAKGRQAVSAARAPRRRGAIAFVGVHKWYGAFPRAAQHQSDRPPRRADRRLRPVRLGQVDADPLRQRARGASARRDRRRRRRAHPRPRSASTRCGARSAWCSRRSTCFRI